MTESRRRERRKRRRSSRDDSIPVDLYDDHDEDRSMTSKSTTSSTPSTTTEFYSCRTATDSAEPLSNSARVFERALVFPCGSLSRVLPNPQLSEDDARLHEAILTGRRAICSRSPLPETFTHLYRDDGPHVQDDLSWQLPCAVMVTVSGRANVPAKHALTILFRPSPYKTGLMQPEGLWKDFDFEDNRLHPSVSAWMDLFLQNQSGLSFPVTPWESMLPGVLWRGNYPAELGDIRYLWPVSDHPGQSVFRQGRSSVARAVSHRLSAESESVPQQADTDQHTPVSIPLCMLTVVELAVTTMLGLCKYVFEDTHPLTQGPIRRLPSACLAIAMEYLRPEFSTLPRSQSEQGCMANMRGFTYCYALLSYLEIPTLIDEITTTLLNDPNPPDVCIPLAGRLSIPGMGDPMDVDKGTHYSLIDKMLLLIAGWNCTRDAHEIISNFDRATPPSKYRDSPTGLTCAHVSYHVYTELITELTEPRVTSTSKLNATVPDTKATTSPEDIADITSSAALLASLGPLPYISTILAFILIERPHCVSLDAVQGVVDLGSQLEYRSLQHKQSATFFRRHYHRVYTWAKQQLQTWIYLQDLRAQARLVDAKSELYSEILTNGRFILPEGFARILYVGLLTDDLCPNQSLAIRILRGLKLKDEPVVNVSPGTGSVSRYRQSLPPLAGVDWGATTWDTRIVSPHHIADPTVWAQDGLMSMWTQAPTLLDNPIPHPDAPKSEPLTADQLRDSGCPGHIWWWFDASQFISGDPRYKPPDEGFSADNEAVTLRRYVRSSLIMTLFLTLRNASEIRRLRCRHTDAGRKSGVFNKAAAAKLYRNLTQIYEHTALACSPTAAWQSPPMPSGSTVDWRLQETTAPLAHVVPIGVFA